jgi:ATP-dependent exoDNAse (exonuclease V) beta subunit
VRAPSGSSALGLLWADPVVGDAFDRRLAETGDFAGEPGKAIPRDPMLLRLPAEWRRPPAPPAPAITTRELARSSAAATLEFDWVSATARHVGTVVHRELQRLARGQVPAGLVEDSRRTLQCRFIAELAELGVPHARRDSAAARAVDAIDRALADARGRWLLEPSHRDAQSELALTGVDERTVVSVVIDRTFIDADGVRWIVDYKTSSHEGAGLEAFLDSERERYRSQLERYARLLRRLGDEPIRLGLYFPLHSAWREWAAELSASE